MAARKKTPSKPARNPKSVAKAAPAAKSKASKKSTPAAAAKAAAAPKAVAATKAVAAIKVVAAPTKKVAKKKATPAKSAPLTTDALARKIVRATTGDPAKFKLEEFYAPEIKSYEAVGDPAIGLEGLNAKGEYWNGLQEKSTWKARNVVTNKTTIVIEWEAEVTLRDGRTIILPEIAIHHVKAGKIVEERYYYDPTLLAPAPKPQRPAPQPMPEIEPGEPAVDPIDL